MNKKLLLAVALLGGLLLLGIDLARADHDETQAPYILVEIGRCVSEHMIVLTATEHAHWGQTDLFKKEYVKQLREKSQYWFYLVTEQGCT